MTQHNSEWVNHFVRGAVATGLITVLQAEPAPSRGKKAKRSGQGKKNRQRPRQAAPVLKQALQGGFAVAAGMAVANSLQQGEHRKAALQLLAGAGGVLGCEWLLNQ